MKALIRGKVKSWLYFLDLPYSLENIHDIDKKQKCLSLNQTKSHENAPFWAVVFEFPTEGVCVLVLMQAVIFSVLTSVVEVHDYFAAKLKKIAM